MTLAEELAADIPVASNPCRLCVFLNGLAPEARAEWQAELAKPSSIRSHTSLLRALARRDAGVSETGLKRHRRNHAR